jgi:hypothetical protein
MKKLLFLFLVAATIFSCNRDEDKNFSAIEELVGEWVLQSKTIDNVPVQSNTENLFFFEDNDLRDFSGNYQYDSENTSSGAFTLDTRSSNMIFTSNIGTVTSYEFYLNRITMILSRTNEDGTIISDTWIKQLN